LKEPTPLDELRILRQNLQDMKEEKPVESLDQGTPFKEGKDKDKTPVKVEALKIPLENSKDLAEQKHQNEKEEAPEKKAARTPDTSDAGFDMINLDVKGL
jgi:hypothetical protein